MASNAARSYNAAERRVETAKLRRDGYTLREISSILFQRTGRRTSHTTVWNDLKKNLSELADQRIGYTAEDRELHVLAIDDLLKTWTARARPVVKRDVDPVTGRVKATVVREANADAADRVLRILAAKAQVLGLNAPMKIETEPPRPIDIKVSFQEAEPRDDPAVAKQVQQAAPPPAPPAPPVQPPAR